MVAIINHEYYNMHYNKHCGPNLTYLYDILLCFFELQNTRAWEQRIRTLTIEYYCISSETIIGRHRIDLSCENKTFNDFYEFVRKWYIMSYIFEIGKKKRIHFLENFLWFILKKTQVCVITLKLIARKNNRLLQWVLLKKVPA